MSLLQPVREKQLSTDKQVPALAAQSHGGVIDRDDGGAATLQDLGVESPLLVQTPNAKNEEKGQSPITIGEALEATAITAGNKLVERSDAAAIQAAVVRATGRINITPCGLAATAQAAAQINAKTDNPDEKITLADILADATSKLPKDRAVTRQDAEGVVSAEMRNNPDISTYPTGVAASVVAAARINQRSSNSKDD